MQVAIPGTTTTTRALLEQVESGNGMEHKHPRDVDVKKVLGSAKRASPTSGAATAGTELVHIPSGARA